MVDLPHTVRAGEKMKLGNRPRKREGTP